MVEGPTTNQDQKSSSDSNSECNSAYSDSSGEEAEDPEEKEVEFKRMNF